MKPLKILGFMITVIFLLSSCAANRQQMQVKIKPVEIKIDYSKVDVDKVVSQLSKQISSTMQKQQKRRVAVMTLTLPTGEMTELGIYLSEKLTNSLFQYQDQFEVVERSRIESVFKEMQLGFTGVIDNKTAQSVGKIVGADAIVIGTITDLQKKVDINVRMLGTERANVIAVASSLLEKNDVIDRLIKNIITKSGEVIVKEQKPVLAVKPVEKKIPEQQKVPITGEKSLVAYYPFNGNANDESGNGNNGIVNGATLTTDRFENLNNAYSFNGMNAYIEIKDSPSLRSENITLEAWVKFDRIPSETRVILGKTLGSGTFESYVIWMVNQRLNAVICDTNGYGDILTYNMNVAIGRWYHIAYTFNDISNYQALYVDGNIAASGKTNKSIQYDGHPLTIGSEYEGERMSFFSDATIDDIRIYNYAFSESEIKGLYNIEKSNDGLVAYYPFNGNANDESGNGNNGTVYGATLTTDRFGNENSAYNFDGMNDYLDLGNPLSITGLGPSSFSIGAWIKTTLTGIRKEIISFGYTSLNKSECFYINSDNQVESDLAYSYGPTSAVTVTDGNWHFVCVVNNDNVFQIYIDGAASGNSQTMSPNISSGSVHIGTVPETSACFFNGSIDEVRIYNRALSEFEIQGLYNSGN